MTKTSRQSRRWPWLLAMLLILVVFAWSGQQMAAAQSRSAGQTPNAPMPCVGGMAGPYPCSNIDVVSHLTLAEMGADPDTLGNEVWAWTDPQDDKEYAIMGLTNATVFVDISDPVNPLVLGTLPTHTSISTWRDISSYGNYAYIIADTPSQHGMQVFDLTQLRNVANPPVTFSETNYFDGFGDGHNMYVNEATGYGYVVRTAQCSGALYMIDLSDPLNPAFAGCFDDDGMSSDTQCVIYHGTDTDYQGQEICFTASDDAYTIGDVTDKSNPVQLARITYNGVARAHQGSLTEDHRFFLLADMHDEMHHGHNTRTRIWNVDDLDNPLFLGYYEADTAAADHNIYVKGRYAYGANYRAGLRIFDLSSVSSGQLIEVAYLDTHPTIDSPTMDGLWSAYPWLDSGLVVASDSLNGLYIFQPDLSQPTNVTLTDFGSTSGLALGWSPVLLVMAAVGFGFSAWLAASRLRPAVRR
jgi:choice-of-anchor B domain-containing protein